MFEIRDGVILTDETVHMDDAGHIMVFFADYDGSVMFVCRNEGVNRIYWQISSKTDVSDNLYFDYCGLSNHEKLIDVLRTDWPEDLMWLLFHPEIYDGRYDG